MVQNSLTILGSSSALPTSERNPTAQVLQILGRFFLLDCAEGTQMQLRKMKVSFSKIQAVFISHLHGDHFLGIFGVISTFNLLGRKQPLTIYGPPKLQDIITFNLKFLENGLKYKLNFIPLKDKECYDVFEDKKIKVTAFKLLHGIPCWGFRFQEVLTQKKIKKEVISKFNLSLKEIVQIKNGEDYTTPSGNLIPNNDLTIKQDPVSYAFVTDTLYKPEIVEFIKNVSLLYHEATFDKELEPRAKQTFHSTTEQAAQIAKAAQTKKLIIGHFSARYKDLNLLLLETKKIFPNTELAEDLKVFEI